MRRPPRSAAAVACLTAGLALGAGCSGGGEPREAHEGAARAGGPYALVLGTAQDGGFPHAACSCERCSSADRDPTLARAVASLALVLPAADRAFLVDATPDLRSQLERLRRDRGRPAGRLDRAPVDGVLLTHAHWGHYAGLGFFGFESIHARRLPVHCSESMARFLSTNAPWDQLVRLGNVELRPFDGEAAIELGDGLRVTPFRVPHRKEYTDTVGLLVEGPRRRLLYVPDTDGWHGWEPTLPQRLEGVDVALLDGTFYSVDELPGRDARSIGHPPIVDTVAWLGPLLGRDGPRVYFTHLNHSNPALDPRSAVRAELERSGFAVLGEGQRIPL